MKSLRFNWINGSLVLLLLIACFVTFAISGKLTPAHAATTNVTMTVYFTHPVTSVQVVSVEGGMNPICLNLPYQKKEVTTTVGSGLPLDIYEFTKSHCKGSVYKIQSTESGAVGTTLIIHVP